MRRAEPAAGAFESTANYPFGVRLRVNRFMPLATRPAHARSGAAIRIDAEFEAFCVHVISDSLHAVRESLRVWHNFARGLVARHSPAVVYSDVLVSDFVQAVLDECIGDPHDICRIDPPTSEVWRRGVSGGRQAGTGSRRRQEAGAERQAGRQAAGRRARSRQQHTIPRVVTHRRSETHPVVEANYCAR